MSIKTGDIVLVNLDPTQGSEKKKTRPCVVLVGEGHPWNLITILPLTEDNANRNLNLFVSLSPDENNGLSKHSAVDCFQIRCISSSRIIKSLGFISEGKLDEILTKVKMILGITSMH